MKKYFTGRQKRVALNGQTSLWKNMLAGVPQDSVLGPLLFSIYMNEIDSSNGRCCLTLTLVSKPQKFAFPINATTKITLHWSLMTPRYKSLIARNI